MRVGLTWLTMGNLPPSLPVTSACAMVARSKSPLDFNAKAGPPEPSPSSLLYFSTTTGHQSQVFQKPPTLTLRVDQSD